MVSDDRAICVVGAPLLGNSPSGVCAMFLRHECHIVRVTHVYIDCRDDTYKVRVAMLTHIIQMILVGGVQTNLSIISVPGMPGEDVLIQAPENADISVDKGKIITTDQGSVWTAPDDPGLAKMEVEYQGVRTRVNLLILTPFENGRDTVLNGYRVGTYAQPMRNLPSYAVPRGFIDLTTLPEDLEVSPHFRLGQFRCKQQPGHEPAYLLVSPQLLVKLEALLAAANARGWEADTFFVMSGYRTPFYNAAIGNTTTSSRHLYGDAADIYIDHDRDGQMDDLDGNGRITRDDAHALAALAHELSTSLGEEWVPGGISAYGATAAHGPFVHVDTRGYPARW